MKSQIILLAMITVSLSALTGTNQCACEEITEKNDCGNGCGWVTVGSDSSCQSASVTQDCTSYKTDAACNALRSCVWKTDTCAAFSACSEITTTADGACAKKSSRCTDGASVGAACVDVKCTDLKTSDNCNNAKESDTSVCAWTTTCVAVDISKCSTINNSNVCQDQGCQWESEKCVALTCAKITEPGQCLSVLNDDQASITVCSLDGTTCSDAADASKLTVSNCKTNTFNTFAWDGTTCSACEGSSSNSYLLTFIGILAMLLI